MRAIHMTCTCACTCCVRVKSKPAAEVPLGGGHRLTCEGAAEPVAITRGLRDDYVESILRESAVVSCSTASSPGMSLTMCAFADAAEQSSN
eukprot:scaffold133553_cov51-Phaeocystis_antarctica.AAC.1